MNIGIYTVVTFFIIYIIVAIVIVPSLLGIYICGMSKSQPNPIKLEHLTFNKG